MVDSYLRLIGTFDANQINQGLDKVRAGIADVAAQGKQIGASLGGGQLLGPAKGIEGIGDSAKKTGIAFEALNLRSTTLGRTISSLAVGPMVALVAATITLGWAVLSGANAIKQFERDAERCRQKLEDSIASTRKSKEEYENLDSVFEKLTVSGKATDEQLGWLRDRVEELAKANPELMYQLGYTLDIEGNLVTVTGQAVTAIGDLQTAFNNFSAASLQRQINNAITNLANFAQAQYLIVGPQAEIQLPGYRQKMRAIMGQPAAEGGYFPTIGTGAQMLQQEVTYGLNVAGDYLRTVFGEMFGGKATEAIEKINEDIRNKSEDILKLLTPEVPPFPAGGGAGGGGGAAARITRLPGATWLNGFMYALTKTTEAFRKLFPQMSAADRITAQWTDSIKVFNEQAAIMARFDQFPQGFEKFRLERWREGKPEQETYDEWLAGGISYKERRDRWRTADTGLPKVEKIANEFIMNLQQTLTGFLEDWGWRGGKPDFMGAAQSILRPATQAWGGNLASFLGIAEAWGGPIGGLISGGIGWGLNRLFGDKPLEVKQPVDIRIVDIETRLLNFFNFRGMDPFTYSSGFRKAFEGGLY